MRIGWLLLGSMMVFAQPLRQGFDNLSDRIHHTEFKAQLKPDTHMVEAYMKWNWRNETGQPLERIPFHLYLNAFSDSDTVFMKESRGGQLRGDRRQSDEKTGFGYCQVIEIKDREGISLMDLWEVDRDIAWLQLPQPLPPGETIELEFYFESRLPKVFARSGFKGTFNLIGQWFPKPGVFVKSREEQPEGEEGSGGKWNCWNYHAHSEFFADFGTYHAELTVPDNFLVGATGVLVEKKKQVDEKTGANLTTYVFDAADVHDFVWTADSNFQQATENYEGININLLYQKGLSQSGIEQQMKAARDTFSWFDEHVGPYPFTTMTIVQPPDGGNGAGGMEYPNLVTAISYLEPVPGLELGAMVTVHEIGHNYWQGMLASNEFEESWMDEGINSYTEARIMTESYGANTLQLFSGLGFTPEMTNRMSYLQAPDWDPVVRKSWEFMIGSSYNVNSYSRPALILLAAQRLFGVETLDKVLSIYCDRWSFKHPTTQDFLDVVNEVSPDLGEFLYQCLYTRKTVDLQVITFKSEKLDKGGFAMDEHGKIGEFQPATESDSYSNQVVLFRRGQLIPPPVDVKLIYEDGSEEVRTWTFSDDPWVRWEYESSEKLEYVQVDPDCKLLLDLDFTNNFRNRGEIHDSRISHFTASAWQFLLQMLTAF